MENKKTPETLTPEQMESGKWYVVDTFLIKFKIISNDKIYRYKCYELQTRCDYSNNPDGFIEIQNNDIIRPATKEEVLKYFPDEVFENVSLINEVNNSQVTEQQNQIEYEKVELRPKDLKAGEVYTIMACNENQKWTFKFVELKKDQYYYSKMYHHESKSYYSNNSANIFHDDKFYHATPEEVKLLLGEETPHYTNLEELSKDYNNLHKTYSDLMAKYEELQDNYEKMELSYVNSIETQDAKYDALADRYTKLEAYNDELTERINQTEIKNNQEKVYFYLADMSLGWTFDINKECAINLSQSNYNIYEAIVIGKKKSVLVSE